jgi:hypothetical protein
LEDESKEANVSVLMCASPPAARKPSAERKGDFSRLPSDESLSFDMSFLKELWSLISLTPRLKVWAFFCRPTMWDCGIVEIG